MWYEIKSSLLFNPVLEPCDLDNVQPFSKMSVIQLASAFAHFWVRLWRFVHATYGQTFIICGVVSVWIWALSFSKCVNYASSQFSIKQWRVLYDQYNCLKYLSKLANKAFGSMVLVYQISAILYYSRNLDILITNADGLRSSIRLGIFYFGVVFMFVLAADICHRVSFFKLSF